MEEFEIRGKKYVDRNGVLAGLASEFRFCGDWKEPDLTVERTRIANEYNKEVDRLIEEGLWDYAPNFDEMLPSEWMSDAFKKYWGS